MNLGGVNGRFYAFTLWVMRLSYLNLLWLLFTMTGLVVFGFFPATTAMFTIVRKWMRSRADPPVFKTFWETYRKEFIKSNKVGALLALTGIFMYLDFRVVHHYNHWIFNILEALLVGMLLLFIVLLTYIFPVLVHYETGVLESIKNALIIGILSPLTTVSIVLTSFVFLYISLYVPSIIIFFTGSVLCLIDLSLANREIRKIDDRKAA